MTFGQLRETAAFQAGIPDIDALGAWLNQEIVRRLDELTMAHKYSELYAQDTIVPCTAGNPLVNLISFPSSTRPIQRIDKKSFIFFPNGVEDEGYKLRWVDEPVSQWNEGQPTIFTLSEANKIKLFPFSEITANDTVRFNFWGKATDNITDNTVIPIPQLEQTLLHELVQEITAISGDRARFQIATNLSQRSYNRSFGVSTGGSMNQ